MFRSPLQSMFIQPHQPEHKVVGGWCAVLLLDVSSTIPNARNEFSASQRDQPKSLLTLSCCCTFINCSKHPSAHYQGTSSTSASETLFNNDDEAAIHYSSSRASLSYRQQKLRCTIDLGGWWLSKWLREEEVKFIIASSSS